MPPAPRTAAAAGDLSGREVPLTKSTRAVLRPRSSRSGSAATSAPQSAMGSTLPRASRALPAGSLGR
eukprot:8197493-Lingulodinium_polyedra.AAC.1